MTDTSANAWVSSTHRPMGFHEFVALVAAIMALNPLAMDLMLQALKKVSAFTQNLTLNLEPVYGILMAFFFFSESKDLKNSFYAGFTLIALSVVLQMGWIWRGGKR